LPNNWLFLLQYAQQFEEAKIEKQVRLTLDKIALGGIYDQVGGGFTRYSVDVLWKVPHFEKMLYDNGQLIGLYAKAYARYQTPLYKDVVLQTFDFLERELRSDLGAYFSALDADSEGEEGKFYCWTPSEIDHLFGTQAERVKRYYHINQTGHWEDDKHIPLRKHTDSAFAKLEGIDLEDWLIQKVQINEALLSERSLRVRPGLDNKLLVSWNAMTAKGLLEAYRIFEEDAFLIRALKILSWIKDVQWDGQQLLRVNTNQQKSVAAFLEDYAHTIEALSLAYQCTGQLDFLAFAKTLTEKVAAEFQHPQSKMCYFTASDSTLISRNMELHDNVIASSNSVMAHAFLTMGFYYQNQDWTNSAQQMLQNIYDGMETYGSGYSNWGLLLFRQLYPEKHWHVLNNTAPMEVFQATKLIDCLLSYHQSLPCSKIYTNSAISVCEFGSCHRPVQTVAEALVL
jgi:uncharacterized protein YyaL (SSP411 family)